MDLEHPLGREAQRLAEDAHRAKNWKRWGPYLSERQWATVREDYSPGGDTWGFDSAGPARPVRLPTSDDRAVEPAPTPVLAPDPRR